MKIIVSIDLAIHQTGVAVFAVKDDFLTVFSMPHMEFTKTIKDTYGAKYKILDHTQFMKLEKDGFFKYLADLRIMFATNEIIWLIEWNPSELSHLLEKFTISVVSYLWGKGYNVIPIQANRWFDVADKTYALKRDKYPSTRAGNKMWIADVCHVFWPKYQFQSQDEEDASLMALTFLNNPTRFMV